MFSVISITYDYDNFDLTDGVVITVAKHLNWNVIDRSGMGEQRHPLTVFTVGAFAFFKVCGILLTYASALIAMLSILWVTSIDSIGTMYAALWDYNNMPIELYSKIVK